MSRQGNRGGAADLGQFLNCHDIGQGIAALSAILSGNSDSKEAGLGHLLNGLTRETLLFVHILGQRLYLVLGEVLKELAGHLMFLI